MSDAAHKDDLDVRLSVTETKVVNIESDMTEQKVMLKEISVKVDGLGMMHGARFAHRAEVSVRRRRLTLIKILEVGAVFLSEGFACRL